jgi:hypothetical protein
MSNENPFGPKWAAKVASSHGLEVDERGVCIVPPDYVPPAASRPPRAGTRYFLLGGTVLGRKQSAADYEALNEHTGQWERGDGIEALFQTSPREIDATSARQFEHAVGLQRMRAQPPKPPAPKTPR